ncbi:hypothetical protein ABIF97_004256 [Bradyrhizobium japonicum]
MNFVESPPRSSAASVVFRWQGSGRQLGCPRTEQSFGGLFVSRTQAFGYALFENGDHPEAIVEVSSETELDFSTNP